MSETDQAGVLFKAGARIDSLTMVEFEHLVAENAQRLNEALNLYCPLPKPAQVHESRKRERVISGANRSSKTLTVAVEVARALTGQDPFGKYPTEGVRWFGVGYDLRHIGKVMYPMLFKPGAFKVIRDRETRRLRVYKPWTEDKLRWHEAEPAPPLIPPRFYNPRKIGWHDKKRQIPAVIPFYNGSTIDFAASTGKPAKGFALHGAWFDEELEGLWYEEIAPRLMDHNGVFLWSVTPEGGTEQLYRVHERWLSGDPDVEEWSVTAMENPYIEEEEKRLLERRLPAETAKTKIHGLYVMEAFRIFPEFNTGIHCCGSFGVPANWTRFMMVDPGRQICGVLFGAIPPEDEDSRNVYGDAAYIYDELYIARCSAKIFGEQVRDRVCGVTVKNDVTTWVQNQRFHAFFIDSKSGSVYEMGCGLSIQQQYSDALRDWNIKCETTADGFTWGSTDVDGGIESIRQWLQIRPDGTVKLKIMRDKCPSLVKEIENYRWKPETRPDGSKGPGKKPRDGSDHLIWGLRVLAAFRPTYIKPRTVEMLDPVEVFWREYQKKKRGKHGDAYINLGPPV